MSVTRRQFVRQSATLAAAAMGLPMVASSRVLGANEEIRMAVVGCGVRGGTHVAAFGKQPGVRIVAVCDPDRERVAAFAKRVEASYGNRPAEVGDVRQLMDRKDFDVLSVATMQYWHSLPTIWACETGRHVYVEKPLAHFIWEGRQMVNAARKYNRLVQVGTQARSRGTDQQVIEYLRSGQLGKIQYIVCFANKARTPIGKRSEPLPIPETLDYELWCGPARKEPIYRDRIQYDCSFTWNMGDGESCNQGVHEVDMARLVLGDVEDLPRRVISIGGRFVFNDACDVPNTQIIYYDFPEAPILYEVHNMTKAKGSKQMPDFRGRTVGVAVDCEGGWVDLYGGVAYDKQNKKVATPRGPGEDHFANFVKALRSGKQEDLAADILVGHLSTRICHAGNISYRVGAAAPVAEARKRIQGVAVFEEMYDRFLEHLKAHEVNPDTAILGEWLECDTAHECIKDHAKANELVRGSYREPYVVPDLSG